MDKIDKAFSTIDRSVFLTEDTKEFADADVPLSIGFGQTNSQPTTVRWMLEWLEPQPGDKALDVGSGSGWTTALLAYLVGPRGQVYATEKVPELVEFGEQNCQRLGIRNVRFFKAGDEPGLPKHAPYDRILVSAAAERMPDALLNQLKINGRLVIPIRNTIHVIDKTAKDSYKTTAHPGFVFVPLT